MCTRAGGVNRIFDENAFDIFYFDGGYCLDDCHGYGGIYGHRVHIKTKDFRNSGVATPRSIFLVVGELHFNSN